MPTSITCECGKKLRVKDELAGKRVKCPGCGAMITASQPGTANVSRPKARSTAGSAAVEQPDEPEIASADAPARPTKKAAIVAKKGSKTLLIVGVGAVGVLFVLVLLCGFGAWFFLFRESSENTAALLAGEWMLDAEATRLANPDRKSDLRDGDCTLDIRPRGADLSIMRKYPNVGRGSTWRVVSRSGPAMTLESFGEREGEQLTVSPAGVNQLRVQSNRTDPPVMIYSRK